MRSGCHAVGRIALACQPKRRIDDHRHRGLDGEDTQDAETK
jgi:hypothetical protein